MAQSIGAFVNRGRGQEDCKLPHMHHILIKVKPSSSLSWAWPSLAPACYYKSQYIALKVLSCVSWFTAYCYSSINECIITTMYCYIGIAICILILSITVPLYASCFTVYCCNSICICIIIHSVLLWQYYYKCIIVSNMLLFSLAWAYAEH